MQIYNAGIRNHFNFILRNLQTLHLLPPNIFPCPYSLNAQPPKEKGKKQKALNAHVSSQCLVNKKGSIFFTLAIVKDAGIDQGMLRLACI